MIILDPSRYHLRFFLTPKCNLKCFYCNPNKKYVSREIITTKDVYNIAKAGIELGIERIHWTGGEPTLRKDLEEIISLCKELGFKEQVITTNGSMLKGHCESYRKKGLNRINISLDSLDPSKYKKITGRDYFNKVICGLNEAIETFDLVKINVVILKENINETYGFLKLCEEHKGKFIPKFIELHATNPAFYNVDNRLTDNHVGREEFLREIKRYDPLFYPVSVRGENPNCMYFRFKSSGTIFGLITSHSFDYRCGDCRKIRISPFGEIGYCINFDKIGVKGKSYREIKKILNDLIIIRESLEDKHPNRKHLTLNYGHWRFGEIQNEKC